MTTLFDIDRALVVEAVCTIRQRGIIAGVVWNEDELPKPGSKLVRLSDLAEWPIKSVGHYAINKASWKGIGIDLMVPFGSDVAPGDRVMVVSPT